MQTKTYHLICYFLFALALVLIGTIGSAGILVAACAAEDTMGSAVNRLCELHLIVPLVLGIVILLILCLVGMGEGGDCDCDCDCGDCCDCPADCGSSSGKPKGNSGTAP